MQSLVGQTIVNQCQDYTCLHCYSLSSVYISQDDVNSQEWFCSVCRGRMLITKKGKSEISIEVGSHGPNFKAEPATSQPCCSAFAERKDVVIPRPTKVVKPRPVSVIHPPLGPNIFNEDYLKPGETVSGKFFAQNSLAFEKGFAIGSKLIDFRIMTVNGDILWDNADLEETDLDKASLKAGIEGILQFEHLFQDAYVKKLKQKLESWSEVEASSGGAWNPHERIKKLVRDKSEQFKPAKGKFPCVLALYNNGSIPAESDLYMRQGLEGNRYFQPGRYTAISAVAVLEETYGLVSARLYHNEYAAFPLWRGAFPLSTSEYDNTNLWDSAIHPLDGSRTFS